MVKENKLNSDEFMWLIHRWNCNTLNDIIREGRQHRGVLTLCRKIMKSKYLRIQKLMIQNRLIYDAIPHNKIKLTSGMYRDIFGVTSKEFRQLLKGKISLSKSKFQDDLDTPTIKEYLNQIKRLYNTRHKNTLLRIWNGDCLSYSRLRHLGAVATSECPTCNNHDTPEHMLFQCVKAKEVWDLLMRKIPKGASLSARHYGLGINDSKSHLMVKAEILKHLMHFRELEPNQIINRSIAYLKLVNKYDQSLLPL
jgi:hypothetical protein